ncbi:hypothetical protein BDR26DRAFT_1003747 [Obelidium mucronatum]|nr:hypothetical protein BDR26DRAFT_1003747 [Obelidium mucronatum]
MTVEHIEQASRKFFRPLSGLPKANRIQNLLTKPPAGVSVAEVPGLIEVCIQGARVCVHGTVLYHLIPMFLDYKLKHGSVTEQHFYQRHSPESFLQRLIIDRPLVFFGPSDYTLLRDYTKPDASEWKSVGSDSERPHITLDKGYMSFDEMMLAALVGVSAPTLFINTGDRRNNAIPAKDSALFHKNGIYMGLVGARFEDPDHMESQYILVDKVRSTAANGYGAEGFVSNPKEFARLAIFARAFGRRDPLRPENWYFPTYEEVEARMIAAGLQGLEAHANMAKEFVRLDSETFFNVEAYKLRITLSAQTLLLEANQRCVEEGAKSGTTKEAFVHVVGLGLGVWQVSEIQNQLFVDAVGEVLQKTPLPHVRVVNFSWIEKVTKCVGVSHSEELVGAAGNKIIIEFSKRGPAERLPVYDTNKLLVASFAWDSNAYVGNEYWLGMSNASGDPAAAACSIIGEVLNPSINVDFPNNVSILDSDPQSRAVAKIEAVEALRVDEELLSSFRVKR